MVVNSSLVGEEVVVDGEGSLNGSVGLNFLHDIGNAADAVNANTLSDVAGVGGGVSTLAGLGALGGWVFASTARSVLSSGVMVARRERVGLAVTSGVVQPSANESGVLVVAPSGFGVSTIAAISAAESTASEEVLSRDTGLVLLATGNAVTVAHSLGSTESPAGSAVGLITNFLDGFASGPGSPRVEVLVDISNGIKLLSR